MAEEKRQHVITLTTVEGTDGVHEVTWNGEPIECKAVLFVFATETDALVGLAGNKKRLAAGLWRLIEEDPELIGVLLAAIEAAGVPMVRIPTAALRPAEAEPGKKLN